MSGHSKWKTIQHKKGAADAKRGKIFSKLGKEITIAAKAGGGNPDMNPALRTLVAKARASNMPADNVERAIKKGTGELDGGAQLEEVTYEGYIGGGVAVVIKVLTDNKNRAAAEVRHVFTKFGTNLAGQGSVSRNFKRRGQIIVETSAIEEDKLMSIVLDAGAEDMSVDDDVYDIVTEPSSFAKVEEAIQAAGVKTVSSEITLVPDAFVAVTDKTLASTAMRFIETLEELEDVQDVYSNMDVEEAVLKEIG